jgi:excinuclease ABC subunit A
VVVDRFKVRADLQQRLAESFETALKLADGIALVAPMDDEPGEEMIFSARFACPICGHAISELEPKLFSFNNPAGACPTCDGLGVKQFFDIKRLVNGELTLAEGAIRGWDRRNVYYFQMLGSLASHYKFSLEVPFNELPANSRSHPARQRLAERRLQVPERPRRHRQTLAPVRRHRAEPGAPLPRNRIGHVREELAKFLSTQACPDCRGTRLRREAARMGRRENPAGGDQPADRRCLRLLRRAEADRPSWRIADKILKEIRERLQFLVNVGLDYLSLDRSADTLSGGEAQRIRLASQIGAGLVGVLYILDEPSIGLHQRDNDRLLGTLKHLRDIGNTVIVVEHERRDSPGRLCGGYRPGCRRAWRAYRRRRHAGRSHGSPRLADRQVPVGPGEDRGAGQTHAAQQEAVAVAQGRSRQQFAQRRPRDSDRAADLRDRCFRLRQIDADQQHAVP